MRSIAIRIESPVAKIRDNHCRKCRFTLPACGDIRGGPSFYPPKLHQRHRGGPSLPGIPLKRGFFSSLRGLPGASPGLDYSTTSLDRVYGNGKLNSQGHGKQFSHGHGKQKSHPPGKWNSHSLGTPVRLGKTLQETE